MMGADLLERFQRAGLEATGQRRNVTVLFVDITGYSQLARRINDEDLYELIQRYLAILAKDVYRYDGMVDKFTGDGLMALFGAPVAHENNAELAIRAALDMQTDVTLLSQELSQSIGGELRVHIGLNSGSVIVGGVGSDLMMNYTAIGDTVNLAQRLEEFASPGTIVVSDATYQRARALFDFSPVQHITPKGMNTAVPSHRVIQLKSRPGRVRGVEGLRAPMVGRELELRKLMEAIGALATYHRGQCIFIVGEAGLGKSRLIAELKSLTIPISVAVAEGQSLTYRRTVSYWIFQDLLRNLLHITNETSLEKITQHLRRSLGSAPGGRVSESLPYLEHLLGLPVSDATAAQRIEYLDALQLRQQIFLAVRSLLISEALVRPLILIFEDLHWADEASLDLLQFLLDSTRQSPLLILGISRPYETSKLGEVAAYAERHLPENFSTIHLQSLTPNQSSQLLQHLLSISELPADLRDYIVQRASGIPFYLEEILRMLIDTGVLQRKDGQWQVVPGANIASLGVPDSLQSLILARFDRLEPSLRRILQAACVIGRQFSLPVLQSVIAPKDDTGFNTALLQLVERDFITPDAETPESAFSFRHVIVSDAIYSTILRRDRAELHGQVGEAIERTYADHLDSQVDLLARHYSWSTRKDRALHYAILAGQKATRSNLANQAREYFEDALSLLPKIHHTPLQAVQVNQGLGDLLVHAGEYPAARQHFQYALETISGNPDYVEECSELQRKISTTFERQGEYEKALNHLAQAESILQGCSDGCPAEKAHIYNDLGWIHFHRGNMEEAERLLKQALIHAQECQREDIIASVYNRLGGVYYQTGEFEQAQNYVHQSLEARQRIGDIVAVARSYSNLGLLGWRMGNWQQALQYFEQSMELHATLGDVEGTISLHSNMGLLLTDMGQIAEARRHLELSLAGAVQIGHSYLQGLSYHHLSRYYLAIRDWRKSLDYSRQAMEIFREIGVEEHLVDLYASMGEAWLGLGNLAETSQCAQTALGLFPALLPGEQIRTPEYARVLRLNGRLAQARGDSEIAANDLQHSSQIYQELGNPLEHARTLAAQAEAQPNLPASQSYRESARAIFEQFGAQLDLQHLDETEAG
jgi:predicted ATPase/class 3 adenylate cyclase